MPHLSPPTLTAAEQRALLAVTAGCLRDHTVFSLALGTGLRLGEIAGLNVGDVYFDDGNPRTAMALLHHHYSPREAISAALKAAEIDSRGERPTRIVNPVPLHRVGSWS